MGVDDTFPDKVAGVLACTGRVRWASDRNPLASCDGGVMKRLPGSLEFIDQSSVRDIQLHARKIRCEAE